MVSMALPPAPGMYPLHKDSYGVNDVFSTAQVLFLPLPPKAPQKLLLAPQYNPVPLATAPHQMCQLETYKSVPTSGEPGDARCTVVPVYRVPRSFRASFRTLRANLLIPYAALSLCKVSTCGNTPR
eukprot:647191-Rhodomonas_salina.1